ncbi:MAG: hypothetical protein HYW48_10140 [Deltaproteobacteria bacterium]|nr:hypothetical protein [Deltaproteobacteria bacterium]
MKQWILKTFLVSVLGVAGCLSAQEQYESNLREACRARVAGQYLSVYDKVKIAEANVEFLKGKRKKLVEELDKVRVRLGAIEPQIRREFYDISLQEEKAELLATISRLESTIRESQSALVVYENDVLRFRDEEATLKQQIMLLFVLKPMTGSGGGYPFRWEYQDSCPVYNESCDLSPARARLLAAVFEGYEYPEVCRKFAEDSLK